MRIIILSSQTLHAALGDQTRRKAQPVFNQGFGPGDVDSVVGLAFSGGTGVRVFSMAHGCIGVAPLFWGDSGRDSDFTTQVYVHVTSRDEYVWVLVVWWLGSCGKFATVTIQQLS